MDESDEEYTAPQLEATATPSGISSNETNQRESSVLQDGVSRRTRSNAPPLGARSGAGDLKTINGGYSWEDEYQRPWDIVNDGNDDEGRSLETIIQTMIESRKKKIMKNPSTPFQRGIIRTLIVIIDGSLIMLEKDLRPTRFSMVLSLLQDFIVEYFDQNPISQLGIVMMRNGVANLVSEVNGLPQYHLDKIRQLKSRQHNKFEPKGDPSLQNSLEMARSLLVYNFGNNINDTKNSKEILIIFGALFTTDPGDIHQTINNLVKDEIKVKVIGLSAQVAICQELVNKTNNPNNANSSWSAYSHRNNYGIIMNETHFRELLMDCVIPLPVTSNASIEKNHSKEVPLIKMGFPLKIQPAISSSNSNLSVSFPQLCACHPSLGSADSNSANDTNATIGSRSAIGYECPQCRNKVCHLPTICPICGLMLILSTHLARSYHHLVPLGDYKEVPVSEFYKSTCCFGCLLKFPSGVKNLNSNEEGKSKLDSMTSSRYRCDHCQNDFCIDCDVFVHEVLHNCPGCENKKPL